MTNLLGLKGLRRTSRKHERTGYSLYGAVVASARDPYLYGALGVPDTLDGRFDLVALYAFLLVHRLGSLPEPGPSLAQAVFDAMFSDMDMNLREMGVGDLVVGKRVRAMWEAFHGRSNVYAAALETADGAALEAALARNVWRGEPPPVGSAESLARLVVAQATHIGAQPLAELAAGHVGFLSAQEAVR